jgi:peptide deformylase
MSEKHVDTIIFDTNEAIKPVQPEQPQAPILDLVPETSAILLEHLEDFDFKNPPVNPNALASALVETCKKYKGLGLSANQCGLPHRVFVMGTGDDFVAFFNPKLLASSGESHMTEGCLSFPFLGLKITRPAIIDVEYQDFNGIKRTATYSGLSARCFLHELDHMNGIVYTQKCKPLALQMGMKKRGKVNRLIDKMEKNLNRLEHGHTN